MSQFVFPPIVCPNGDDEIRDAELKMSLVKKRAETQTEKLRAEFLSKATVDYEIRVQEAQRELYMKQRDADADLYAKQQLAEAEKAKAAASAFVSQQSANSELYAKTKEAEGIAAMAQAEGLHLSTLMKQLGGNYLAVRDYLMIKDNVFKDIAKINAQAINGLQPNISVWFQGSNGGDHHGESDVGGGMRDVARVYGMLPPLLATVNEQTGMVPLAWLGSLPSGSSNANGV